MRAPLSAVLVPVLLTTTTLAVTLSGTAGQTPAAAETSLRVQRALQRLPYYGVFDFLAFGLDRGTVTLMGYAYRGSLKTDAAKALRRVPGVEDVIDQIELLPASQRDEGIRWATFSSLYGDDQLSRYIPGGELTQAYDFNLFTRFPNMQPVGMYPVHIIVKDLRTTLVGAVDSHQDRTVAETRARLVPGVLGVDVDVAVRR